MGKKKTHTPEEMTTPDAEAMDEGVSTMPESATETPSGDDASSGEIEEHEAEARALRLLANPPPSHDAGLLFKMKAADDRSTLNEATAWDRHEMEVANLSEDE